MRAKRQKGRAKLTQDGFGRVRALLLKRKQAEYLAAAQAVADAEARLEAATAAAADKGDDSDEEKVAQPQKKSHGAPRARS